MALQYILDGYNIIRCDPSGMLGGGTLEQQRDRLVALVRERQPQGSSRNSVTVVFDGPATIPNMIGVTSVSHVGDIRIFFSEGLTADEKIEELVTLDRRPSDIVVVTNDRGIQRLLGGTGAKVMPVAEFLARLFKGGKNGSRGGKTGLDEESIEDINEELKRQWLR